MARLGEGSIHETSNASDHLIITIIIYLEVYI